MVLQLLVILQPSCWHLAFLDDLTMVPLTMISQDDTGTVDFTNCKSTTRLTLKQCSSDFSLLTAEKKTWCSGYSMMVVIQTDAVCCQ